MKRRTKQLAQTRKTRKTRASKGESLVECLASLFILTLMITGISTMINTSLRLTQTAMIRATARQGNINDAVQATDGSGPATLTLKVDDDNGFNPRTVDSGGILVEEEIVTIDIDGITITDNSDFFAFEPPVTVTIPPVEP